VDSGIHHIFREGMSSVAMYKKSLGKLVSKEWVRQLPPSQWFLVSGSLYALAALVCILLEGLCGSQSQSTFNRFASA